MTRYIVCYDISNDRRRRWVADTLDGYGDRVQGSVFELPVDRSLLERCMNEVAALIEPEEDCVAVYRLCANCDAERQYLGRTEGVDKIGEEDVFIV